MSSHFISINIRQQILITVQQNPSWQLSLAQLSPSLLYFLTSNVYCVYVYSLVHCFKVQRLLFSSSKVVVSCFIVNIKCTAIRCIITRITYTLKFQIFPICIFSCVTYKQTDKEAHTFQISIFGGNLRLYRPKIK